MIVERYRLLRMIALLGFRKRQNIPDNSPVDRDGVTVENSVCRFNRDYPSGGDERIYFCPMIHAIICAGK